MDLGNALIITCFLGLEIKTWVPGVFLEGTVDFLGYSLRHFSELFAFPCPCGCCC